MYLDKAKKEEIFAQFGKAQKATDTGSAESQIALFSYRIKHLTEQKTTDTGSAESQIALFTYRIKHLTEHVKQNRKDYVTTRSLTQLVGKRRALLDYLYDRDIERYRAIVKALGLRK